MPKLSPRTALFFCCLLAFSALSVASPKGRDHRDYRNGKDKKNKKTCEDHLGHAVPKVWPKTLYGKSVSGRLEKSGDNRFYFKPDALTLERIRLPNHIVKDFLLGDRLSLQLSDKGEIGKVLLMERRFKTMTGRFRKGSNGKNLLEYRRGGIVELLEITGEANPDDYVRVTVSANERSGVIEKNFGKSVPAEADLEIIAAEFGLFEKHSEAALAEARSFKLDVEAELSATHPRKDMRHVPFWTIDPKDAKDFDQAIHVEATPNGWFLQVALADVSHYVAEGSQIDVEAQQRGNSVYFPGKAFHMLPTELSQGLCSLMQGEDRLSMVVEMDIDRSGKVTAYKIRRAIIRSTRRATYEEIAAEVARNSPEDAWLKPYMDLYGALSKRRQNAGKISIELPKTHVLVNAQGEPKDIVADILLPVHRMNEEMMVLTNETLNRFMRDRKLPTINRSHENPDPSRIEKFAELAASVDFMMSGDYERLASDGVQLARVLERMKQHPAARALQQNFLRALPRAGYTPEEIGHFGLASKGYTHGTAQIRRYGDLVVWRMIKQVLAGDNRPVHAKAPQLLSITEHLNSRERLADDAEKEMNKIKTARYLAQHIGESFSGIVMKDEEGGCSVQLDSPFSEIYLNGCSAGFGQRVRVKISSADPFTRNITGTVTPE